MALKDGDEIIIRHEHCIEAILLKALIFIINKSFSPESICMTCQFDKQEVYNIIEKLIISLESTQTKSDIYNGVFRCRVSRPEGMHPVYASLMGYQSLQLYQSIIHEDKLFINKDLNAKVLVKCKALKQLLDEAIKQYGLNSDYADMTLIFQRASMDIEKYQQELAVECYSNRAKEIQQRIENIEIYYNNMVNGNN